MSAPTCIVTPTHNNEDLTIRCFDSIRRHTSDYLIVWVDNGSSAASRGRVGAFLEQNRVPHVKILLPENLGFAGATNIGMRYAVEHDARHIVLQNNDTEVFDGWLGRLVRAAERDPGIGLVGPLSSPCASWQSVDNLKQTHPRFHDLPDYGGDPEEYARTLGAAFDGQTVESSVQLAFFSVLMTAGLVADIGVLSEEFGIGFGEDDDYCIRALKAGWKIVLAKDVLVYHRHRSTFKALYSDEAISRMLGDNRDRYVAKHIDYYENYKFDTLPGLDRKKQTLVAFVSHTQELVGGGEKSLLELIDGLPRDRFYCTVLLPGPGGMEEELKRRKIYYEIVGYRWWTVGLGESRDGAVREIANCLPEVVQTLDRLDPDVIYTNTTAINAGAWAARLLGIPHVWHVREFGEIDHGLQFVLPFVERARYIARHADLVIFNSLATRDEYALESAAAGTEVIYNDVSVPPVSTDPTRYFTRETSFKMAVVGSIQPGKGQKDALLAVSGLLKDGKDVELLLVGRAGDSEYAGELRDFVEREHLEENVVFTGLVRNISDVLAQLDLVLVCSRNEAFGRVAVEAMLSGKPVVGTRSKGTLELVREGVNGFLYDSGNIGQLKGLIVSSMADLPALRKIGAAGRAIAQQAFPVGMCASKIGAALERLASGRETPGRAGEELERTFHAGQASEFLEKKAKVVSLEALLAEKETAIVEKDAALAWLQGEIHAMRSSLRWRTFEPLCAFYARNVRRFIPDAVVRRIDATPRSAGKSDESPP